MKHSSRLGVCVLALCATAPEAMAQSEDESETSGGESDVAVDEAADTDAARAEPEQPSETEPASEATAPPATPLPAPPPPTTTVVTAEEDDASYMEDLDDDEEESSETAPQEAPYVTLGIGAGVGVFFSATGPGQYVQDWQDSLPGTLIQQQGTPDLILYFLPKFAVTYSPIPWMRFEALAEYGWGPKIVTIAGGDTRVFNFGRGAGGLLGYFSIPINRFVKEVNIGAGVTLNRLHFEEHAGTAPGLKVKAFMLAGKRRNFFEVYVAYDHTNATSERDPFFNLNYASLNIGGAYHFGVVPR